MGTPANVDLTHHLAAGHVDESELANPARRHDDLAQIAAHVHAVRTAGRRETVHHFERLQVDHADGVGHPVADQHMALVAERAKGMGAHRRLDELDPLWLLAADVVDLDTVAAGQRDQHEFVVGGANQVGGCRAGWGAPLDSLRGQVNRNQLVAFLHGRVNRAAFAVDPQMAGRLAGRDALGKRHVLAVPMEDVDMVEAVGSRHKPLHVGRKPQVVRIDDAAHGTLDLGRFRIDEGQ